MFINPSNIRVITLQGQTFTWPSTLCKQGTLFINGYKTLDQCLTITHCGHGPFHDPFIYALQSSLSTNYYNYGKGYATYHLAKEVHKTYSCKIPILWE